jgi:hypothetical protein
LKTLNKKEHKREYMKRYLRELKHWAVEKLGRKCVDCGLVTQHDCVYDFHHEDNNTWGKDHVAKVYQLSLWKKLDKVPDDIKLLCANCHRIRNEHGEN